MGRPGRSSRRSGGSRSSRRLGGSHRSSSHRSSRPHRSRSHSHSRKHHRLLNRDTTFSIHSLLENLKRSFYGIAIIIIAVLIIAAIQAIFIFIF